MPPAPRSASTNASLRSENEPAAGVVRRRGAPHGQPRARRSIRLIRPRSRGFRLQAEVRLVGTQGNRAAPIALHPDNPHYFLWRGQPTILITSAEHYGAVMNLDFDYRKYLDTLAADGLNYTRIFSGAYVEPQGAFNIARNTLAPGPGRFIAPWARSNQPGYANGGNKFDLTRWDAAYFTRLKDFVAYAANEEHRRRADAVLPDVRGDAVEAQPDERGQQRERRRRRRAHRRLHARQARRAAGRAGGAHAQDRHRAERVRQPVLRDLQRALLRRRDHRLAASHRRRDRRDRARPAREASRSRRTSPTTRRRSSTRIRRCRSSTSTTRRRPTPSA